MTGNVRDNCCPHIHLLPTRAHLASTDFIRLLSVATSADPHIRLLPIARCWKYRLYGCHFSLDCVWLQSTNCHIL